MYRFVKGFRNYFIVVLLLLPAIASAKQISTFYGPIEVEEPILLELIESPAFQRLKFIRQYGVAYYVNHPEEFNRFDHSLGVFALLRAKGCSLEEQIAGLLHDVSHTAFSHVGDWVYGKENAEDDYQNSIHCQYLDKSGLSTILRKYNYLPEKLLPEEELFPALEKALPDLCADRIDYNIQGAYHKGFITRDEAIAIFNDLQFINNQWVSRCPQLMKKLTQFSFHMTRCWGAPTNQLTSRWLADALLRAIELGDITHQELQFGTDEAIWHKLATHEDAHIKDKVEKITHCSRYFTIVDAKEADCILRSKFRGIDPLIQQENSCSKLTAIDASVAYESSSVRTQMEKGFPIKLQAL